jgi:hypothetical protein
LLMAASRSGDGRALRTAGEGDAAGLAASEPLTLELSCERSSGYGNAATTKKIKSCSLRIA